MQPKISVIVPIYKAEKYLHRCVDSILAQTFTNFELILVDDGSPDGSGAICDEYAKKDSRIKVFHQENGGPSSARNTGLDNANGDIICFVDCDDIIDDNFLDNFGNTEADITIQAIYRKFPNKAEEEYFALEEGMYTINDIDKIATVLYRGFNIGTLCTRALKHKIIKDNNLKLNINYKIREDEEFVWRYMCYCQTITLINKGAYHYDSPNMSIKYNKTILPLSDCLCTMSIINNLQNILKDKQHTIIINNINRFANIILNSYRTNKFSVNITKEILAIFCKYYKQINEKGGLSLKCKFIYYLIGTHTPKLLHIIYHYILSKL